MTNTEMALAKLTKESTLDEIKAACVDTLVVRGFIRGTASFRYAYMNLLTEVLYVLEFL